MSAIDTKRGNVAPLSTPGREVVKLRPRKRQDFIENAAHVLSYVQAAMGEPPCWLEARWSEGYERALWLLGFMHEFVVSF